MATINTNVWGDSSDWHDVATYDQTLAAVQKCERTDEVIDLWQNTKLIVDTPWDKTLSYCGLGTESPLSNIKFLRRVIPYFIYPENWDGSKFDELVVSYDEEDVRSVTNFAIGSTEVYSNKNQYMCQFKSDNGYLSLEQYGPRFQRWGPLSRADEAMQWIIDHEQPGSSPDPWCNVASSTMYTQIPVKNMVAIPYITCVNSIATKRLPNNDDLAVVDLATYLTEEQDEQHPHASYLTHPYILQVCLKFVQSGNLNDFNNHERDIILSPSTCFILDETNMYSDINPDCKADDEEGYDFTTAYMYNQLMNWFGAPNTGMPILGLTSIPGDWHWRDGWPISFGPSDIYQYGDTLPDLKDVSGRFNFPIWIGSEYLEEHAIMNDNPSTAYEATDGAYVYYMSAGNDPAELREKIRRAVACFGLFFVDGYDDRNVALDDNKMMLGILEDGVGHGDYSFGLNNRLQDQWNWEDMHENEYDPVGPQPEPGDDPAASDNPLLPVGLEWTLANTGTGIWAVTPSNIDEIWHDIFSHDIKITQFGDSPMNAIISLEWTPFTWSSNDDQPVVLGSSIVNPLHSYPLIKTINSAEVHGYGQMRFKFNKNFYNARNMQARLFLPFYGYYELPAAQLLSSQLRVDFYYDIPDELGVWIISYDKVIYDFVECNCKIEIPITGSNAAAIRQNKTSEALTIATQIAGTAAMAYAGMSTISAMQAQNFGALWGAKNGGTDAAGLIEMAGIMSKGQQVAKAGYASSMLSNGVGIYNTVMNAQIQRAALRTNLPYHGSALQTTFLHMSMKPYVQIFKNTIMSNLATTNGGKVTVELGGTDETQYKLKVGHACDIFTTINAMPENSLLQTTGIGDNSTAGMELAEINELKTILQSGFLK